MNKTYAVFKLKDKLIYMEVNPFGFSECVKQAGTYYKEIKDNMDTIGEALYSPHMSLEESMCVGNTLRFIEMVNIYDQEMHKVMFFIEHAEDFDGFSEEENIEKENGIFI